MPVVTIGDGTALVVINPISAFLSPTFGVNSFFLPFVSVVNGSTTNPFVTAPSYTASPFTTQYVNASTFAVDSLQLDFI